MNKKVFLKKWITANTVGMLIAYLLYTPIAHGITGGHENNLTTNQLVAHCIALAVVGLILFLFQKSILKNFIKISSTRILASIFTFIVLFWVGYYQTLIPDGPDFDILFGYLALGSGMWFGLVPFKNNKIPFLIALLSFPLASFIGEVIFLLIVTGLKIELDLQSGMLHHSLFWITVGVTTGLVGGWISGKALFSVLRKSGNKTTA